MVNGYFFCFVLGSINIGSNVIFHHPEQVLGHTNAMIITPNATYTEPPAFSTSVSQAQMIVDATQRWREIRAPYTNTA